MSAESSVRDAVTTGPGRAQPADDLVGGLVQAGLALRGYERLPVRLG
jgi:hypothetical protein